jgi:hypothetical protein
VIEAPIVIEAGVRVGRLRTHKAAPGGQPAHTSATESTAADAPDMVATTTEAAAYMSVSDTTTEAATHMSASAATTTETTAAAHVAAAPSAPPGGLGTRPCRCTKRDGDTEDHDRARDGFLLDAGR